MLQKHHIIGLLWLVLPLLLLGCGESGGQTPNVSVGLTLTPNPPQVGSALVQVSLQDDQGPVSGAVVELEGNMHHAGMVPVFATAEESTPGQYQATLEFTMGGDWFILVKATLADGSTVEEQFDITGVTMPTRE